MDDSTPITSLSQLAERQRALRQDLHASEERMRRLWTSITRPQAVRESGTGLSRMRGFISFAVGATDAFILGYKLYRKLKG